MRERPRPARVISGRPHLAANAALALVSAALAAALFLVVLLLIEGWRLSPIAAAAAVTVMPICALLDGAARPPCPGARGAGRRRRDPDRRRARRARAAAGCLGGADAFRLRRWSAPGSRSPSRRSPRRRSRAGLAAGDPRRLDDRRPPRRRGRRPAPADAGLHRRSGDRARRCRAGRDRRAARLAPAAGEHLRPRRADRGADRARGRQGAR